jgi:catechol 2,3-dioxygenase
MSTTAAPAVEARRLPATLRVGAVHLTVADLDRSVAWYQRALGLRVHAHEPSTAALGDGDETVVVLHEDPVATPAGRHAGLYHLALLYPSREELARAVVRLARTRTPVSGASDHRTHEALYLPDPDGNGLELAADRPRDQWPAGLGYDGGPAPLDVDDLLTTVAGEPPADHVGPGLRMGHLHLHVGDVAAAKAFYGDVLGLDVMADLGSAAFLSAGGYHHHLGVNVWRGTGVGPAPEHTAGLRHWTVQLPAADDVAAARDRLAGAGHAPREHDGGLLVDDPWGTALAVVATTATAPHTATATVRTERPSPYLLQLAKHFAHKLEVRFDERRAVIPFGFGVVTADADPQAGTLTLTAHAHTAADLARTRDVAGGHLERFGRRDALAVSWR